MLLRYLRSGSAAHVVEIAAIVDREVPAVVDSAVVDPNVAEIAHVATKVPVGAGIDRGE